MHTRRLLAPDPCVVTAILQRKAMSFISREWRIMGSVLFSVALIAGAYYLAQGGGTPRVVEASTETELLKSIASRDTDSDGLPDWEEALYGTDPKAADSRNLGVTDGEAVAKGLIVPVAVSDPSTTPAVPKSAAAVDVGGSPPASDSSLTTAFAKAFFTLYLAAKQQAGTDLSSDAISTLASEALTQLSTSISAAPDYRSLAGMKVSGAGESALRSYAATAEQVFTAHAAKLPKSEIVYLQDAVDGDVSALAHIATIATTYNDTAAGLAALAVPQEVRAAHLEIVNATARIGGIAGDFTKLDTDPLATMLALEQYPDAVRALIKGFADLAHVYSAAGIVLPKGSPGASVVNLLVDTDALSAAKKP